jgi:hypothetical protein
MTFLEFLVEKLLGPRVSGTCWRCPFCDSSGPSFSVRPPSPLGPVKFKCFRCGTWGDEHDLVKHLERIHNYQNRLHRLNELRDEYEREEVHTISFFFRGVGSMNQHSNRARQDREQRLAGNAWANLTHAELEALIVLRQKVTSSVGTEVSLDAVAEYHRNFKDWTARTDAEHRTECNDRDHCDDAPCRKARGLPPLTLEEIKAGCYRVDGHAR